MKKILSLLLVALMIVGMLPMTAINAKAASESYVKVTAAPADWSGEYLIVYEDGNVAFNGELTTLDAASNTVPVTIADGEIAATEAMKKASFTIEKSGSNYTIKSASGYYIGQSSNANGLKTSQTTTYGNTISINADYSVNFVSGGAYLRYNFANDQLRFRYYKSSSYSAQKAICLYKLTEAGEEVPCTHDNATTTTVDATCTADGSTTVTCDCGYTETTVIPATGHSYVDGVCSACGEPVPAAIATKITTAEEFVSGKYVMVVSSGYAMGNYDSSSFWVLPVQPIITGNDVNDAAGGIWTLTVGDSSVTIQDANGVYIAPKGGNNNGISTGEYSWNVTVNEDGSFTFAGNGGDTVYLASNTTANNGDNKFRAYKTTTVNSNLSTYLKDFELYKVNDGEAEVPPCEVHNYVDGVCTVCGAIDQEWEGEPDTTDPTDPEETDPTEPEETEPAGGYELATYISVGDQIVIVASDYDVAMSTNQKSNNRGQTSVTKDGNKVTFGEDVQVLTVEAGTKDGTFAFNTGSGYLYAASSGNNYLRTETALSDNSSWTVIITDGVASIVAQGTNTRNVMQYNLDNSLFACYASASQKAISLYKYVAAGACEHTWGEWVETTAPTCTDAGVETATCTLCGETKTQSVAATGHSLVYDGNAAFACSKCEYAESFTLSDISTVKGCSGDGKTYYIKGIVTYVNGREIYMEDATGGILVYGSANFEGINIGDELLVWDTITTYSGKIETSSTSTEKYLIVSNNNALPSKTVTIAELVADGTAKEYYGERVVIENVTMGVMGTNNTALTDADGNTINIYKLSGQSDVINENDTVTVTAIVSAYNSTSQLVIDPDTAATDIVEIKDGAAEEIVTVTIAEAKAGTAGVHYQVEGTVTYISGRNVYIQDATGGIVVYLTKDAATTQVGDKVKAYGALKLYKGLIELDAVDETNTQFYEILSSGNTVDAQKVTIEGLLADTSNEYLAEKITLNNVYVSYYDYFNSYGSYYVTYTLVDGNGNSIKIYKVPVASEEDCVAGGSIVNVEAIVSAYDGYQLVTDNAKITVTGTCAHETTELVNVKDATLTAGGYTGDTMCTVCGNYTERGEDTAALTDVDSWGLTLGGDILVNFKIALAESIKDSAQITVAVADKTYTYAAKDYYADGYVYVSASVAAAQMTDEITVTVINGEDQAVKPGYTIKSYAETVLNGDYDEATKALVTAMVHYGAAAQTFFNYKTDAMANADLDPAEDVTIPADAAGEIEVVGSAEGITFYGASLVFENKIAVRFYFTGSAEDIKGAVEKDGKFYIEVAGINPQDLGDAATVKIGELSVSYSPMNYIVRMAEKNENEDLVELVKALYSYHLAAQAYATANAV